MKEAAKQEMPGGTYTVLIKFPVEKNGDVRAIQALNDPGQELKTFAIKIDETGPKWYPGIQNGRRLSAYHTRPIPFIYEEP